MVSRLVFCGQRILLSEHSKTKLQNACISLQKDIEF